MRELVVTVNVAYAGLEYSVASTVSVYGSDLWETVPQQIDNSKAAILALGGTSQSQEVAS